MGTIYNSSGGLLQHC